MKPRAALVTILLFLATLLPLSAADADPVRILSGAMVIHEHPIDPLPLLDIEGTRGFRLNGIPDTLTGSGPWQCHPCDPRTVLLDIRTIQGGSDLPGTVDFEGVHYSQGIQGADVLLFFTGAPLALPRDRSSAVVSGPFQVTGFMTLPDVNNEPVPGVSLIGHGTATFSLIRSPEAEGAWDWHGGRYDFESDAPIPEPGTMLLVGSGLIAVARRLRRPVNT